MRTLRLAEMMVSSLSAEAPAGVRTVRSHPNKQVRESESRQQADHF
jgi:hypothetical protein